MSAREAILRRVRDALGTAARDAALPQAEQIRAVIPAAIGNRDALREAFMLESEALHTDVRVCPDLAAASCELRDLAREEAWEKAALHDGLLTKDLYDGLACRTWTVHSGMDMDELESCNAGITECDALVASSGSILLTSRSAGGRALSVLPPHHVVVATTAQLVPDLGEAFARLKTRYAPDYPEFISFVTGPSRTGDIERILVLGAHGPRRLTVLLIDDGEQGE